MDLQHINIKIMIDGELAVDPQRFIEVFHAWVRDQALGELLIDVADYRHVPAGPGVMLIALEADYSMDHGGGHWGLRYNRKAPLDGDNAARFGQAMWAAAGACRLLEGELGPAGLKFSRCSFELFVNDRLLAPNAAATYDSCIPQIAAFLRQALGHDGFELEHHDGDTRRLFGVTVTCDPPFDLDTLITTLQP